MAGTGAPLSLMDLARRTDPDGDAADIAELLSQANEIYDDIVWKEGNTNTGHVFTVRTGIPAGTWRYLNAGVPVSHSTTAQGRINCGMLEGDSTIDLKLLEMAENRNKFRYEEDNAFLEGMAQTIAGQMVYGNALSNPAAFTGFEAFYNTVSTTTADNAANVFDGGGTGSNNTSLLLVGWSPRSIYGVFPKGSAAGLKLEPLDYTQVAYDSVGNKYRAAVTWFRQEAGFCVEDWRWGSRLCNLDVTSAGLGGNNPFDIFATMSKMVLRLPESGPRRVRHRPDLRRQERDGPCGSPSAGLVRRPDPSWVYGYPSNQGQKCPDRHEGLRWRACDGLSRPAHPRARSNKEHGDESYLNARLGRRKSAARRNAWQRARAAAASADLELDHIIAVANGDDNSEGNLQFLCMPCNRSKGALDQEIWLQGRTDLERKAA